MRVGLVSDIHGNITGLRAVLAYLDSLGGLDHFVAAGDLVGGGPGADDLMELLLERKAIMVRGNNEEAVVHPETTLRRVPERFKVYMQETAQWLREHLSASYWEFLAGLPLVQTLDLAPGYRLLVCHASPRSCWDNVCSAGVPVETLRSTYGPADAAIIAYGHWHAHHVLSLDGKLLLNVASVGLRKDGLCAVTVLDYADGYLAIRQQLVPYDSREESRMMVRLEVPLP